MDLIINFRTTYFPFTFCVSNRVFLGISGNSAISIKGKGLTNVICNMYVERNVFFKW